MVLRVPIAWAVSPWFRPASHSRQATSSRLRLVAVPFASSAKLVHKQRSCKLFTEFRCCASTPPSTQPSPSSSIPTSQTEQPSVEARSKISKLLDKATALFPVWVLLGTLLAVVHPPAFYWFKPQYIVYVLALVMSGMGLTLSLSDFGVAFSRPGVVLLGCMAQYGIMPSLGWGLGKILQLPPPLAAGLILVSVCPGGAASNLVCLIADADVALSVVLTLCSTMLSIVMIPTLMKLLCGSIVPISPLPLLISTAQVVLLPLAAGLTSKALAPRLVKRVTKILPFLSVIGVTLICGSIVSTTSVASFSPGLIGSLALLHGLGGLLGYAVARVAGLPVKSQRTMSIEVMMQNSSLAVALALAHFPNPLTAVPGAISATMHSVMGSFLAGAWRWIGKRRGADKGDHAATQAEE
jgi:bile acid:Na+ symporter, BASS family